MRSTPKSTPFSRQVMTTYDRICGISDTKNHLQRELKKKDKELQEEKEKIEILKKSLHIFMQPRE